MSEEILNLNELTSCTVICYNSFSCKDALKSRGYQYNAGQKAWQRKVDTSLLEQEIQELLKAGMKNENIQVNGASKPSVSSATVTDSSCVQGKADILTYYILEYDYNTKYTVCTSEYVEWIKSVKQRYPYLKVIQYRTPEELYLRAKQLEAGEIESNKEGAIRVECTTPEQLEQFANENAQ